MKIEKALFEYYEEQIQKIPIPPTAKIAGPPENNRLFALLFAALLAFSVIPMVNSIGESSTLAVKASEFASVHELDTRISRGLLDLNRLTSNSSFSGGKK